ncbi:MAG: DUF3644 domain-containing protein [Defluviicoccus sp.]|nr:DUF3644 domain-containing protein [Defluviicoccus sp.]
MAKKRIPSVKSELVRQSREAALNAVQSFNNPLTTFKTETFIVLMVIAWTHLLHAYYRQNGIEYRYFSMGPKKRKFDRTKSGAFKHWELERCLNEKACPLDGPTKHNLRFLIGLRHEIEHHRSAGTDEMFSGRYLACCLNYERYICELFGKRHSLGAAASFTLQFRDLNATDASADAVARLPSNVAKYLHEFDAELSDEEIASPHFRRRFLFVPVVTSKKAQADAVIEFASPESDLGLAINEKYQQVMLKEVERPKLLPSEVVALMQAEGFVRFNLHQHAQLWKRLNGKNPGKGYGVLIANTWYWYERWVNEVRQHCAQNKELYTVILEG